MVEKELVEFINENMSFEVCVADRKVYWYLNEQVKASKQEVNKFFETIGNYTFSDNLNLMKSVIVSVI